MSFWAAISAVRSYRSLAPVLALLTLATAAVSAAPSTGLWQLASSVTGLMMMGYTVSVTMAVHEGSDELPPIVATLPLAFRRGLAFYVVILVPLVVISLPLSAVSLLGEVAFERLPEAAPIWMTILLGVLWVPLGWIVWTRYVAFDRISEGFRYSQAWSVFRANVHHAARLGWFWLATITPMFVLRYGTLRLAGLDSLHAQAAWSSSVMDGSVVRGIALVLAMLTFAAISALAQLILAHLTGQYLAVAYPHASLSDSV